MLYICKLSNKFDLNLAIRVSHNKVKFIYEILKLSEKILNEISFCECFMNPKLLKKVILQNDMKKRVYESSGLFCKFFTVVNDECL